VLPAAQATQAGPAASPDCRHLAVQHSCITDGGGLVGGAAAQRAAAAGGVALKGGQAAGMKHMAAAQEHLE
jgi:hypothetical protein